MNQLSTSTNDRLRLFNPNRTLLPYLQEGDHAISATQGGRAAALRVLHQIRPGTYARTRNFLDGDITRLSAYLRHGVLALAEVRDHALRVVADPESAVKLISEFAWRDYWQRLYTVIGDGIWEDREHYKTGFEAAHYAESLPAEIVTGGTSLRCMDSFSEQLRQTGYLHNHSRLWFAAYIVHWKGVRWQAGARWFLQHLIDGDPASNNLSWQWVASTFATSPYIFNRENLERYSAGLYCRACSHASDGTCPFDRPYEELNQQLFPLLDQPDNREAVPAAKLSYAAPQTAEQAPRRAGKALLWHHTDSLNPASAIVMNHLDHPAVFIWDTGWLVAEQISFKRVFFIAECLQEMPGRFDQRVGEPATELLQAARTAGADYILAQRTADPRLLAAAKAVDTSIPIVWFDVPAFVDSSRGFDLKRFSRYWKRAQPSAMQMTRS